LLLQADQAMDRVTSSSVAGKSLAKMSSAKRVQVRNELASTLQKTTNKSIKKTVLGVRCQTFFFAATRCLLCITYVLQIEFKKACEDAMVKHLQESRLIPSQMVRPKRPTVWDEKASLGRLKVGDWVEVQYTYAPGTCSDGGVGCVVCIEDALAEDDGECPPEEAQKGYPHFSISFCFALYYITSVLSQWM